MTDVQKLIKYGAIALAAVLIVSILGGIISAAAGLTWIFGGDSDLIGEEKTYTVSQNIRSLDMQIQAAAVRIELGTEFRVESNLKHLKVSEKNGKLILEETRKLIHSTDYDRAFVTLTVPENLIWEEAEITTGAGTVNITGLQVNRLEMELGAGDARIDGLTVSQSAQIEGGVGALAIENAHITGLNLEMGVGKVVIDGVLTGDAALEFGVGEAQVLLDGSLEDYCITFDKGLGDGSLNGEAMKDDGVYGTGTNRIRVEGGIGSCDIVIKN